MTNKAYYHLPGLFEFYDLYAAFLPIFRKHRDVVFFHKVEDFSWRMFAEACSSAAPYTVGRCAIDRAYFAPVIEIISMFTE